MSSVVAPVPGTIPVPENPITGAIRQIISILANSGVKAAEAAISASPASILEAPVIGFFTNEILQAIADEITKYGTIMAANVVNAVQTSLENQAAIAAAAALAAAQKSGDQNAIKQAVAQADAAFGALGHFDGS